MAFRMGKRRCASEGGIVRTWGFARDPDFNLCIECASVEWMIPPHILTQKGRTKPHNEARVAAVALIRETVAGVSPDELEITFGRCRSSIANWKKSHADWLQADARYALRYARTLEAVKAAKVASTRKTEVLTWRRWDSEPAPFNREFILISNFNDCVRVMRRGLCRESDGIVWWADIPSGPEKQIPLQEPKS